MPEVIDRFQDENEKVPKHNENGSVYDVDVEVELTYSLPVRAHSQREALDHAKQWLEHSIQDAAADACCGEALRVKLL